MLVSDLLSYSLRIAGVLGVGQTALAQDTADALTALTVMLTQWQAQRWLVFRLQELFCPVVAGQATYTIGPSGQITTGTARRPTNIEAAYVRQLVGNAGPSSLPVDYWLTRIETYEEWAQIALKNLQSWPGRFFYDPGVPLGTFRIWPIPIQNFFELHIIAKPDISAWVQTTTDTDTILPAESDEALVYNLAGRLRVNYALPMDPSLASLARASLETLRATNFRVKNLQMPSALLRRGGLINNPYGGFVETNATIPISVTSP